MGLCRSSSPQQRVLGEESSMSILVSWRRSPARRNEGPGADIQQCWRCLFVQYSKDGSKFLLECCFIFAMRAGGMLGSQGQADKDGQSQWRGCISVRSLQELRSSCHLGRVCALQFAAVLTTPYCFTSCVPHL